MAKRRFLAINRILAAYDAKRPNDYELQMKLTKHEVNRLKQYQRNRQQPLTALGFLWRIKPLLLAMAVLLVVVIFDPVPLSYKCFVYGFAAGGFFFPLCLAFLVPRIWRLTREILNWERIEQLLKENDSEP